MAGKIPRRSVCVREQRLDALSGMSVQHCEAWRQLRKQSSDPTSRPSLDDVPEGSMHSYCETSQVAYVSTVIEIVYYESLSSDLNLNRSSEVRLGCLYEKR